MKMTSTIIDLRSDAVTLPSETMRRAMFDAPVGDDDFGEDPTIIELEQKAAYELGKEEALFLNSGSMGNLLAVCTQTDQDAQVIAGLHSHIYDHEYPGIQRFCGVDFRPIAEHVDKGKLHWDMDTLKQALDEPDPSRPALLCLEQTVNRLGGVVMPLDHMAEIYDRAQEHGLPVHLDGARLFNAALALDVDVKEITVNTDTVMTVFTKCLGAPAGAVMAGSQAVIDAARKLRHYLGGGYKQGGFIAAACLVSLDNIPHIAEDHHRTRALAQMLARIQGLGVQPENVVSNLLLVDVRPLGIDHIPAIAYLKRDGVLLSRSMPGILRIAIHRDINDAQIQQTAEAFERLAKVYR